jgi:DNA invertase Pin-like site-specific DNA recombinase
MGKSATDRREFDLMFYLARQNLRPADLLILWDFSRFARSFDQCQFYCAELRVKGWQILSMTDEIPSGPIQRIYEAFIEWKDELARSDLRVHTIRGLRFIVEQGCIPTGSVVKGYTTVSTPIGMKADGTPRIGRKPEIDPDIAPLVIRAFEMKASGSPNADIACVTGLYKPTSGSWSRFFLNCIYIGEYKFHGEVFRDVYPPIISDELFRQVQEL